MNRRRIAITRAVVSLVLLAPAWWIACESLRERAPFLLTAYLLTLWPALVWSAQPAEGDPGSDEANAALRAAVPTAILLALDIAIDAWIPYQPRFVLWPWEPFRLLAVVVIPLALPVRPAHSRTLRYVATALRCGAAAVVAGVCLAAGYIVVNGARDETRPADAALVLGFALDTAGRPQPSMIARVEHAVELYNAGLVRRVLLSGGRGRYGASEASVMAEIAVADGVPADALVLEEASHSTVENFRNSSPLLVARGFNHVLLVSEAFHMPRALLLARRYGVVANPSPAPSPAWRNPRAATYWVFRDAVFLLAEWARDPFVPHHLPGH